MKKYVIITLTFFIIFFAGCNNNVAETKNNSESNKVTVTKISTKSIYDEYLGEMNEDGVYSLECGDEAVIVFVNLNKYKYNTSVKVHNSDIIITYNSSENRQPLIINEEGYLIENCNDNTTFRLFKDNIESNFAKVIVLDNILVN